LTRCERRETLSADMRVRSGDSIENPATRERIAFRRTASETDGESVEVDWFWDRPDHRTPEHVHPRLEERWEVVVGHVRFRIGGVERTAFPGDVVVAPPGTPHCAWNLGPGGVRLRVRFCPALRWEALIQRLFRLGREGRTDGLGRPDPALLPALLREFACEIAPAPGSGPG
jgi:mannose-6-phosphate isomerase-like protein (cupin superfamily)